MRRSAGLPLSVGEASVAMRLVVAIVFAVAAVVCIGGGMLIATELAARIVAALLIIPIGLAGVLAVAFVLAPHSRYGRWLDHFVPRLREPRIAIATAVTFWLIAFALAWSR
jgi:hypothetical protein